MANRENRRFSGAIGIVVAILLIGIFAVCRAVAPDITPDAPTETHSASAAPLPSHADRPASASDPTLTEAERTISAFAQEHGLSLGDYPTSLINLLVRNPETEEFVLQYPMEYGKEHAVDLSEFHAGGDLEDMSLFIQWDKRWGYLPYGSDVVGLTGCGPVSLAMVGYYLTGDEKFAPDKVVEYALAHDYSVKGSGSAWTLISEGAVDLGLEVTEIPLDRERIISNLEAGNPIICVVGPGDFTRDGHFMVLCGCQDGKIQIRDPNSYIRSQTLWDYERLEPQFEVLWVLQYEA